jgi:3-deoxy-manno-octulosonate cytidylyltransferase (CMP-KDO synthetase)
MLDFLIVIPARFKSTRLPGKPLIKLNGIPMLVRTFNQCLKCVSKKKIIVATDDIKIIKLCYSQKIPSIITSKHCLTGTDRVAEVSRKIKAKIYINVQGDEPLFSVKDLKKIITYSKKYPNEVLNGYCKIDNKKMFFNHNVPKVVFDRNRKLLYMSRSPIPSNKKNEFKKAWRQVCVYSLPLKALKDFYKLKKKTKLEKIEDLELLRFIELGYGIRMIPMSNKSISVDTIEDVRKVEKILRKSYS